MATNTSMSDFTILSKIGTGAFSEVYKVFRKSDRKEYALKKVSLIFRILEALSTVILFLPWRRYWYCAGAFGETFSEGEGQLDQRGAHPRLTPT